MFRLLGFDVRVQSGFVVFMALIVFLYRDEFGLWLAGAIAVLTLVHELGHALAARRTGAHAEISLGFLAGYASYRPSRPLKRREQAWISFAGPFVHISTAVVVLLAIGVNPLDLDQVRDSPASAAIFWAGPVIGAMNLIPVLPLDGGNIVTYGLDAIVPGRARRIMLYASIGITVASALLLILTGNRGFVLFIGFLLITQMQMLSADKPARPRSSVWDDAAASLDAGKHGKAQRTLLAALSHPQPTPPASEIRITAAQAGALIDLLPNPLPHGDPGNEFVLANLLLSTHRYDEAAHYAAGSYQRHPNTLSALIVARAAGALHDQATAVGWLRSAAEANTSPNALASAIDTAPELGAVRHHPDVTAVRAGIGPDRPRA
ncbi:MAG: site-2 protease family protein [Ilumatobacter sp.]|uniref:metalloprotease n=1 Tax=Ilumatobacter sp. TaxID=1967498 RepID=UPI00329A093F